MTDPAERLPRTELDARRFDDPASRLWRLWQAGHQPDVRQVLREAGPLSPGRIAEVLRIDQRQRWRIGQRVRAATYLNDYPVLREDPEAILLLIYSEFLLRRELGESPILGEYQAAYPEFAERLQLQLELHDALGVLTSLSLPETQVSDPPGPPTIPEPDGVWPMVPAVAGYEILGELGRGGMGVVYKAFDRTRGEIVALKTMRWPDSAAVLRFKQESRVLADVSHPNLVTLHELVSDRGGWFLAMELIEGTDFTSYVRSGFDRLNTRPADRGRPMAPDVLARLRGALRQLVEGVAALHDAGVLHRDLKPSNVLATRPGRVVILDFGLAAGFGPSGWHQSSVPQVLGTAAYMAPEQAAGLPVSPASDWYSVGSMLFEVLASRPPFLGPPLQVLMDKQWHEPPNVIELVPDLPDGLGSLCTELLRRDPRARPSGGEILRRVAGLAGEPVLAVQTQPSPQRLVPLVGRATHLEFLRKAFVDVRRGRTVGVFVQGHSGTGKTALVRHFLDDLAAGSEAVILAGRCYEQESVPYKALDSIIDALGLYLKRLDPRETPAILPRDYQSLVRVFPVLRAAEAVAAPRLSADAPDRQELRLRAFSALRELLARLGDRWPLVVSIDDMQWGDTDSAALLSQLLRPPDPPRLLLLGCYRTEDASKSPFVRNLLDARTGAGPGIDRRELVVGMLRPEESESLALTLLGPNDPAAHTHAAEIARESGGSPFFIAELVRHVQTESGLVVGAPEPGELDLDEVIWTRVRRLPEDVRRLLEVVVVAGQPLGQSEACRAAEVGAGGRSALALLRSGRLVRGIGSAEQNEVEPYHDRVREAVVARIPPETLRVHHRRLALALELSGRADPEVVAVHYHRAGEPDRAGDYYERAAAVASEALAFDKAATLYRLALELRPSDRSDQRRLRTATGDALASAGHSAEAAAEYLAAAGVEAPDGSFELQRRAASQFFISGHIDEGLEQLGVVVGAIGLRLPRTIKEATLFVVFKRLQIRLRGLRFRQREAGEIKPRDLRRIDVCYSAAASLGTMDPVRGAYFQACGLLFALRAGEPSRLFRALVLEAGHVGALGSTQSRHFSRLINAAEALEGQSRDPSAAGRLLLAQGLVAYFLGRWKDASRWLDQGREIIQERFVGFTWELNSSNVYALWALQFQGRLIEMGRRWPGLVQEARERGDLHMVTLLTSCLLSTLKLADDDPDGAEAGLSEAKRSQYRGGFLVQHNECFGAEIQVLLYRGDGVGAWEKMIKEYAPALSRSLLKRFQKVRVFFHERRARCALSAAAVSATAGGRAVLLRSAEADARHLVRERTPWSDALARSVLAGVAAVRGDRAQALDRLATAVDALKGVDMHLYAASARLRMGQALGGNEGRAIVEQVEAWMRGQGVKQPAHMAEIFVPAVR
jgi:serine/threonine protein kinase/tetratricopeptide (TPR) repeat protein